MDIDNYHYFPELDNDPFEPGEPEYPEYCPHCGSKLTYGCEEKWRGKFHNILKIVDFVRCEECGYEHE